MSLLDGLGASEILANGVAVVRRAAINFAGGVVVVDDPVNKRTNVTVIGGGGGGASTSDGVANLSGVAGATVTQALDALWNGLGQRATTAALTALSATVTALSGTVAGKAAQSALDTLSATVTSVSSALGSKAPYDAEYIVKTLSSALTAERTLEGDGSVTLVDYATPGKAIVKLAATPATPASVDALKAPTYIVQTLTAALDNERTLEGDGGPVSVDFATAGKAKVLVAAASGGAAGLMPATMWSQLTNAVNTSAGVADAGKLIKLDAAGLIAASCLPAATQAVSGAIRLSGTVPVTMSATGAGSVGAGTDAARSDHRHDINVATPVAVGTANSAGVLTSLCRSDHVHDASHLATKLYDFTIVSTATRTLALADLNKCLLWQYGAASPTLTIPRDSTLNLPLGFTCQVLGDTLNLGASAEWSIDIVSEVGGTALGTPNRIAESVQYTSISTTPYSIRASAYKLVTLTKIGADRWLVSGNNVA